MSNDELREFYLRYVGAANAREFDVIADLIHDEVTSTASRPGGRTSSRP